MPPRSFVVTGEGWGIGRAIAERPAAVDGRSAYGPDPEERRVV